MRLRSALPILLAMLAFVVVSTDAMAMLHPRLGRYMQRDPAGYPDGLNAYAPFHVMRGGLDPSGLWVKVDGTKHTWCAQKGDTLAGLAQKKYGASPDDWACLWPVGDTGDRGYPNKIWPGDKYDASNLATDWPNIGQELYVTMDATTLYGQRYLANRPNAIRAHSGLVVYASIAIVSGEGATPIARFELFGHGIAEEGLNAGAAQRAALGVSNDEESIRFSRFIPSDYSNPMLPTPTFERALQRKGPQRCWFKRNAVGNFLACQSKYTAESFAKYFLRKGAQVRGTAHGQWLYTWGNNKWTVVTTPEIRNSEANTVPLNKVFYSNQDRIVTYDGEL